MNLTQLETLAADLDGKFRSQCARLKRDTPWVGRIVLRDGEGDREYFVGSEGCAAERIVDWRHPLGEAFYDLRIGDTFALPAPFAGRVGTVESRAVVVSEGHRLRKIKFELEAGEFEIVATANGFLEKTRAATPRVAQSGLDDILGLLTPAQYRLITASRSEPLIIQGRAGSGKTSVGLHRLSWLTYSGDERGPAPVAPGGILVVMFNKALQKFVQTTVDRMGLNGVRLDTFHGWALAEVKRGYGGAIVPDTRDLPGKANAVALKKQLGILKAVEAYVARQADNIDRWLGEKLPPYDPTGAWLGRFRDTQGPLARRAILMRSAALRDRDAATAAPERARLTEVHRIFGQAIERLTQYKEELLRLLTDRDLLARHLPNALPDQLDDLVRYQSALQQPVGADRRPSASVAFEDLAILLRLMQLKHGGLPDKKHDDEVRTFEHVLIDEAQDFGAVELTAILASVRSRTGVTIVGDSNQKIIPEAEFIGWDALARELGVTGAAVARLEVPHRSTAPIMRLADALVGDEPTAGRPGPLPRLSIVRPDEQVSQVARRVREILGENPVAHIAVVCGSSQDVEPTVGALGAELAGVPVRRGHNEEFDFAPGVTVTNLRQIKGLEFDAVIALDVTDSRFPANEQGMRWLYTLVTRAKDSLHIITTGTPCAAVQTAAERGLLALDDESEIRPVDFTEGDYDPA